MNVARQVGISVGKETPRVPKPRKNREAAEKRHAQLDIRERELEMRNKEITNALIRVNEFLRKAQVNRLEDFQRAVQEREALARLMSSKPTLRDRRNA